MQQIDPAELSPGEFSHAIRRAVEEDGAQIVVIDSLNGYLNAMPDEKFLIIQMHELLTYLGQHGVATMLVTAQHGLMGSTMTAPVDASYLADSVVLLRYFEAFGRDRVHVIIYDDFRDQTLRTYAGTLAFLGVDAGFEPQIEVVNANRRTLKMEVSTDGKTWKVAARTDYNFFEIPSGIGANSASIRVTSASGDVIVVKNVPMQADKSVKAAVNYK